MRRESAEVTAATRRQLELLEQEPVETIATVVVPRPGRHLRRGQSGTALSQLVERFALSPAHLALVAVVVAAGLAIAAWSVLHGAPTTTTVPMAHTSTPGPAPSPGTPTGGASPTELVIDVAGKVRRPGIATLAPGSRVIDAIKHAGGAKPGADLSSLNLARLLVDGEQILVGAPAAAGTASGAASGGSGGTSGSLVNLNSATLEQLEGLPGVGPVTAQKILAWRTAHGAFTAVDELLEVDGIGQKTMADIVPHVTL
jgi:competence protein ComEA